MKKFIVSLVDNYREHTTREIVMLIIMCSLFAFAMYTSLEAQDKNTKSYELQTTHNELVNDYNELLEDYDTIYWKLDQFHKLNLRLINENNRVKEEIEQLKLELGQ